MNYNFVMFVSIEMSSCGITLSLDSEFIRENENYSSLLWREFVIFFYYWKRTIFIRYLFMMIYLINEKEREIRFIM